MPPAVEGIFPEVLERVVHPAHVPLQIEAHAAFFGRPRDAPPGGRFLGNHEDAGEIIVNRRVCVTKKVDGFEILPPAMFVGNPLARLA